MKKIGIYPGNFQPPVKSHFAVYEKLVSLVDDADVYVATTDREPTPDAPLNFGDKEQIWTRHGVSDIYVTKITSMPTDKSIKVSEWRTQQIFKKFSSQYTAAIMTVNPGDIHLFSKRKGIPVVSKVKSPIKLAEILKDLSSSDEELPINSDNKKEFWLNPDGSIQYFQPYKGNENNLKSFTEHMYIITLDDTKVEGNPISTANIRRVLGSMKYNDDQKKKFFTWLFGWFDISLYKLITTKFTLANKIVKSEDNIDNTPKTSPSVVGIGTLRYPNVEKSLSNAVTEILGEIMNEDFSSTLNNTSADGDNNTSTTTDNSTQSSAQQASDKALKVQTLVQQKKAQELQSKQDKQQRDGYATTVRNYDTIKKKANRDKLDSLNKQISQAANPSSLSTTSTTSTSY